jgi:hypothetical protein
MTGKSYVGQAPTDAVLTANDIADGAVSSAKLATSAVTNTKLGALAVTYDKVTYNAGQVIQSSYTEYTTNADLTTLIPTDDTIPQITEGTEVLTASITPKYATSKIRIYFTGEGSTGVAGDWINCALFRDAVTSAICTTTSYNTTIGGGVPIHLKFEESASSVTARTYRIRVGAGAQTCRLNGSASSRFFGGTSRATLVVEEVAV